LEDFANGIDRAMIAPLQNAQPSLLNEITAYYMAVIKQATLIEEFFPSMSANITTLVRQFQLWRKPVPDLLSSDITDFEYSEEQSLSVITSGISAFYSTEAEVVVDENVRNFLIHLIEEATFVVYNLNAYVDALKVTQEELNEMFANLQEEYKIDAEFFRQLSTIIIIEFDWYFYFQI
jgi:hypothetical protein